MNDEIVNNKERLLDLYQYEILDTEVEAEFDAIVQIATRITGVPMSVISLIDYNRQWFKAGVGISTRQTDLDISFCRIAIRNNEPTIVENAVQDPIFSSYKNVVGDPQIRFYAGFPLTTSQGNNLGTLCVYDTQIHHLNDEQVDSLQKLSRQVMKLMELRIRNKQLERARIIADEKRSALELVLKQQQKIMTILAHDTKGLLSSSINLIQLLSEDLSKDEQLSLQKLLHNQTSTTLQMLENLTSWGSATITRNKELPKVWGIRDLIEEVILPYKQIAERKNTLITIKVDELILIRVHKQALSFIIRNIVHNSIKYTDNGYIDISASESINQLEISIKDTGIGMSRETVDCLFSNKVASKEGTGKEPGSGIGLVLVRDFVSELGGEIKVESEEGKGSNFSLIFPKKAGEITTIS